MNIDEILNRIHAGETFSQDEFSDLYENYYYDEDIYDIERKGTILYQVIFSIGNEYYSAYEYRNDMWGSEWDETAGLTRVYPKERTVIDWITKEEK